MTENIVLWPGALWVVTLKPIAISKRGRSITKAAKDPTNAENGDQEILAKCQKTSGTDASTLRAVGEAA